MHTAIRPALGRHPPTQNGRFPGVLAGCHARGPHRVGGASVHSHTAGTRTTSPNTPEQHVGRTASGAHRCTAIRPELGRHPRTRPSQAPENHPQHVRTSSGRFPGVLAGRTDMHGQHPHSGGILETHTLASPKRTRQGQAPDRIRTPPVDDSPGCVQEKMASPPLPPPIASATGPAPWPLPSPLAFDVPEHRKK